MENYENYENLANAVVVLAFKDYVKVLIKLKKNPEDLKLLIQKEELEKFFLGGRLSDYSTADGSYLMKLAKQRADEESTKRIRRKKHD